MATKTEPLKLTWQGAPHTLTFRELRSGRIKAQLVIIKKGGRQNITSLLPKGIGLDVVQKSWEAQGSAWKQVEVRPGTTGSQAFLAVRLIILKDTGHAIVWYVCHRDDVPFDTCIACKLPPIFVDAPAVA